MNSAYRSHHCGELWIGDLEKEVTLAGWVHRVRDHGGLRFLDLRDMYGITQITADPDSPAFQQIHELSAESVIQVQGTVTQRPEGTENAHISTGSIEVLATSIETLSKAEDLPMPVFGEQEYPEETRLRHRYLDLRRPGLRDNILLRSEIIRYLREHLRSLKFTELQTPILSAPSPEGARDYVVPSRVHSGKFYALPQAPQQYKQLAMIAGFDRYFQIAPCFRDEDARADRSPGEFYQLDLEMAFVDQENILQITEGIMKSLFRKFSDHAIPSEFPRIRYCDALEKYGTDKPDLRNPLEIQDVSSHFRDSGFAIFANMLEKDPTLRIRAIPAPKAGSRKFCEKINAWAQTQGQPGMAHILYRENNEGSGPVAKNIGIEKTAEIRTQLSLESGDAVFFTAESGVFLSSARQEIAKSLDLIQENRYAFCWITDYPLYELDERGTIQFSHNPFSMPQGGIEALSNENPLHILAWQYDLVCNGLELSSGAIRNHELPCLLKAFEIAGYSQAQVFQEFSGLCNALRYGAPPHGGIAPGLERIIMLLTGAKNLREVTLFPMTQQAEELLLGAPSSISPEALNEIHLKTSKKLSQVSAGKAT